MTDAASDFRRVTYQVPGGRMAGVAFGHDTPNPDIVFLHATGFNGRTYRSLLQPLGDKFHVLALDSRGHGLTQLPDGVFGYTSWRRHRDDLIAVLEHFTAPVTLAGHSMGGTVSLLVAGKRTDLVSGQISVSMPGIASVIQHVRTGRLRALGVTSAKRSPQLPEVPTISEAGVKGYEADQWLGLIAPARTPAEAISKLNDAAQKALNQPDLRKSFENVGAEAHYLGPKEFGELVKSEMPKWAKVVKATALQIN